MSASLYSIEQLQAQLAPVFQKNGVRKAILFGSYAKGTATKDSDIDIAVVVDKIPGDYLNTMTTLWRLTRSVNHDIEPVLLTAADDESGFLSTVQKTGIAV